MNDQVHIGKVIKMVQTLLEAERFDTEITPALINTKIKMILPLNSQWKELDKERLLDELVRRNSVTSGSFNKLGSNEDHIKWYSTEQRSSRPYWIRYRYYLEERLPWAAIDAIDQITDSVMSDIESPSRDGKWDRRGLVVGHVQSGKTSNYTGLICKAADAGYKIIVVLAGLHNNLRAQTQARLDEGFLGYETNPDSPSRDLGSMRRIGVGEIDRDPKLRPQWVTTRLEKGDFKASIAQNLGVTPEDRPWLFVIKKQKTVLTGLLKWLTEHVADERISASGERYITRLPLLMIDDEADNASVDTGEQIWDENNKPDLQHSPKAINSLIRKILKIFHKKAYVGYTATPFANIFIHEKGRTTNEDSDLFPSAFIYNIPAPSNYIGPNIVFGRNTDDGGRNRLPLIVDVADHTDREALTGWMPPKHNKNHTPTYPSENNMPPSLVNAIDSFLLACCARNIRGMKDDHSSMLIHVTRFQNVQIQIRDVIHRHINSLKQRVSRNIDVDTIKHRMKNLWEQDFITKTKYINDIGHFEQLPLNSWESIWREMPNVLAVLEVKAINGSAKDALDYVDALEAKKVIAIGGDKLSRGLTLEGLVTSYFLRASKMYDTLMQMGRWFGYRDGYIDLCRLYTTSELTDWFEHISDAAEELRAEFDYMEQTGGTPRDYGLKVKSHPTLMVTSPLKMRHGKKMQLSYSGELAETVAFATSPEVVSGNYSAVKNLLSQAGNPSDRRTANNQISFNGYHWINVSSDHIIDFLERYIGHEKSFKVNTHLLRRFIVEMNAKGELLEWNIAVFNGSHNKEEILIDKKIFPIERSSRNSGPGRFSIGRLLSPRDEAVDLSEKEWTAVLSCSKSPNNPNGIAIRHTKSQIRGQTAPGLLMIYLVRPRNCDNKEHLHKEPFVGFGISFPSSNSGTKVTYIVNPVGQDEYS